MVSDNDIYTARVGVVNRLVGGDPGITSDDKLRPIVQDRLESFDVDPMTLLAANRNVVNDIRAQRLERLHQYGRGGLTVHIEIAPDADHLIAANGRLDALHSRLNVRKWRGWE